MSQFNLRLCEPVMFMGGFHLSLHITACTSHLFFSHLKGGDNRGHLRWAKVPVSDNTMSHAGVKNGFRSNRKAEREREREDGC